MMTDSLSILKNFKLLPSQDYEFLRGAAIKHIEKLASNLWTDFNTHDPGVTITELLCYAITDLGYRTSYNIKDILASEDEKTTGTGKDFFTAAQILPTGPVTVNDYRKILADIEGIKNAWFTVLDKSEIEFYSDEKTSELTYTKIEGQDPVKIEGLYNILIEFEENNLTDSEKKVIKQTAFDVLHAHRNLCEDFLEINEVKYEDISICADIEVSADADVNKIQAEIYFHLSQYFSPSINFYTIEELIQKGKSTDQIFDGPLLAHGFIDNLELEESDLRKEIRVSDIINFVMDIEGVVAVKNILLTSYHDNKPENINQEWILTLTKENYSPRLNTAKSKIIFYKEILPYMADSVLVDKYFNQQKSYNLKYKLKGHDTDITIPLGNWKNISDYYPVQNEFPLCYGIGEAGLPDSASPLRKAQASQLKTYLLFFEQILANYFSQLANIKNLFSFDADIQQTYFIQNLDSITDVDSLYRDFSIFQNEHYKLVENRETFFERRGRFLDHLLGRFAESLYTYGELILKWKGEEGRKELCNAKIEMLSDYPKTSSNRCKAFDYLNGKVWNTDNVAGLKKRICRLLDFDTHLRKNISNNLITIIKDADSYYNIIYTDKSRTSYFIKSIPFDSRECAESIEHYFLSKGDNIENYSKQKSLNDKYIFVFNNVCEEEIARSNEFDNPEARDESLAQTINFFKKHCDIENLHVVEHILLRPYDSQYKFIPVCITPPPENKEVKQFVFEIFRDKPRSAKRKPEWRFRLRENNGDIIFKSEGYKRLQGCKNGIRAVTKYAKNTSNFEVLRSKNKRYYFNLIAANYEIVGVSSDLYKTRNAAQNKLEEINLFFNQPESVETEVKKLKTIEEDPYSFRISFVLPSWPEKFRDINFRRFIERTIRLETPAHIYPRICWIDLKQMRRFEKDYKNWLRFINGPEDKKRETTEKMINRLFSLKNVYPVAKLHDCTSSSGDDPHVILDYSTIGII